MCRDIKPENIFLTAALKFKLGDFGLAIRADEELPFTRSGTLDYMAPEVTTSAFLKSSYTAPGIFGLAIRADEELPFIHSGTADYLAPEVSTSAYPALPPAGSAPGSTNMGEGLQVAASLMC